MPNHPKIPKDPRFRHNGEKGEDEFRIAQPSWMAVDEIKRRAQWERDNDVPQGPWIDIEANCANAARCALYDAPTAPGTRYWKSFKVRHDEADAWAAWGKAE